MKYTLNLALSIGALALTAQAFAAQPSTTYPVQLAQNLPTIEAQEKRNDQHWINDQGWDKRSYKYIQSTHDMYDKAIQHYQHDQRIHAASKQLERDQADIARTKARYESAVADQKRALNALGQDQTRDRQYNSELNRGAANYEQAIDQRLRKSQGWDSRADKYVTSTRETYDRVVRRYEDDQKRHASASQLAQDRREIDKAKGMLDKALSDAQRSQAAVNKAQYQNRQFENTARHY